MVKRLVTFKVDEKLLERLDILSKRLNKCRSELIREAIILLLEKHHFFDEENYERRPRVEKIRIR